MVKPDLFCSTIIPTIGRATLDRAVESVINQHFDQPFEVIVINDSGRPLVSAAWQQAARVKVIDTARRERSVARNVGASVARGKYLHFLDDDDWLLPEALQALKELAQPAQENAWLYGGTQLVDRQGNFIIELHHGLNGNCFVQVLAGEWIPLQASLIPAKAFFDVGGFDPRLSGPEDIDLCRRIALTHDLAATPRVVASIGMGSEGSTTDRDQSRVCSRWAREGVLDSRGVLARLRSSAMEDQWFGRIVRVYLTSVVWNLQHRRLFTACSRAAFGLASLALAGPHAVSGNFLRSVLNSYESDTFSRGLRQKEGQGADAGGPRP